MPANELTVIQPSTDAQLSATFLGLKTSIEQAARRSVSLAGEGYSEAEKIAMMKIEELHLLNGLDLTSFILKGQIIHEIEAGAMYSYHPEGFNNMEEMAAYIGISSSQYSNIRDLCDIVFPYVTDTLGLSLAETWEKVGVSRFREIIPILKAMITGEAPDAESVRNAIENLLDDTALNARVAGQDLNDEQLRTQTISNLLNFAQTDTVRNLRQRIRPDRTPNIEPVVIQNGPTRIVIAEMSNEQYDLFNRQLERHLDAHVYNPPIDHQVRQTEMARIPVLRHIIEMSEAA